MYLWPLRTCCVSCVHLCARSFSPEPRYLKLQMCYHSGDQEKMSSSRVISNACGVILRSSFAESWLLLYPVPGFASWLSGEGGCASSERQLCIRSLCYITRVKRSLLCVYSMEAYFLSPHPHPPPLRFSNSPKTSLELLYANILFLRSLQVFLDLLFHLTFCISHGYARSFFFFLIQCSLLPLIHLLIPFLSSPFCAPWLCRNFSPVPVH